jgi:hypothetical protein
MRKEDVVKSLTLPEKGAEPFNAPKLQSGKVTFFKNDWWHGAQWEVSTGNFPAQQRHRMAKPIDDEATHVAYNLPIGTVMTLMETMAVPPNDVFIADLSHCGVCVDLIGTDQVETLNLKTVGLNDKVSAFFWREINMELGAFQVFQNDDFTGARATIFPSEWSYDPKVKIPVFNLHTWWLQDKVSSVKWKALDPDYQIKLYQDINGGGQVFDLLDAVETEAPIKFVLNDKVSSWSWSKLEPKTT